MKKGYIAFWTIFIVSNISSLFFNVPERILTIGGWIMLASLICGYFFEPSPPKKPIYYPRSTGTCSRCGGQTYNGKSICHDCDFKEEQDYRYHRDGHV